MLMIYTKNGHTYKEIKMLIKRKEYNQILFRLSRLEYENSDLKEEVNCLKKENFYFTSRLKNEINNKLDTLQEVLLKDVDIAFNKMIKDIKDEL